MQYSKSVRLVLLCAVALAYDVDSYPQSLSQTGPLELQGDLAAQMVEGIHHYLDQDTDVTVNSRDKFWDRDYESAERYNQSIAPNRDHLRRMIGAVDQRLPATGIRLDAANLEAPALETGAGYRIYAVRWSVLEGVDGEGLLLEPVSRPVARVVAVPDADWTPEMLAGIVPGVDASAQFAPRLAENGCEVLVPVLIDRADTWSGIPGIRMTNQPHREWIYRMSYEAGRHIIGYEVQKILAAVDWLAKQNDERTLPIGVAGYGEGGLIALYSAALDPRIQATLVSGYFQQREELWREPIYRDVWGLLREFGDAEIASLIAPRALVVEASRGPHISGPPSPTKERKGAAPNGTLADPPLESVRAEVERARPYFARLKVGQRLKLAVSEDGHGLPGCNAALQAFVQLLGVHGTLRPSGALPQFRRASLDPNERLHRQFNQLVTYTQQLIATSADRRTAFWAKADSSSPERWHETTRFYRDYIWDEVIGRLPPPWLPPNPRTRLVYDEPKFRGYEVVLDVWPDVFAYGILLVPKDLRPGERRPVVVCQHGLEGRASDPASPRADKPTYHQFALKLAEEGFVTYAPQNPYIGEDRFRLIQRKAHPLKLALFSFILGQHQRTLEWLGSLPFVDPQRIGFYGISYGGKTAVRVPPLLDGYALSICSADFNEWVWKTTSVDSRYSYMLTPEYDMLEFDFANVVNYSDLAKLMAPRPFMIERGHNDVVAPDEWVAYEYAKVRWFYDTRMQMPERTTIEFFNGPHEIHGQGTFQFLHEQLRWP
ncbi:MAG TPA: dienelactone hydrolase family protein [Bryobacteraceae bacterium]|nr:dienelactone hydrolase family protein [Bryobacteraceae bacterium]